MTRTIISLLLLTLVLGCNRGNEQAVTITPRDVPLDPEAVPRDPFGSSSPAYQRLREVTETALGTPWDGSLESFAPWLEEQTVAIERSLGLLKALRVGPADIYAVANARIALVYEQIAGALTEASTAAEAAGLEAEWRGQQDLIWEQANAFWARCVRGCGASGTHLDAWELRCRHGLTTTEAKLEARPPGKSARQPN